MEITDVTTIDQLTDAEVDELLQRALNPRTPIEVFYAVLDRIGAPAAPAEARPLDQDPDSYDDPGPLLFADHAADQAVDYTADHELAEVGGEA